MKTMIVLALGVIVAAGSALAQQADTAASNATKGEQAQEMKQQQDQEKARNQRQELKGFVDKNANGIDDRLEIGSKGPAAKGKDKFIDKDGDGICDERATGMGFRRNNAIGPAGEQAGAMERKRKRGGG